MGLLRAHVPSAGLSPFFPVSSLCLLWGTEVATIKGQGRAFHQWPGASLNMSLGPPPPRGGGRASAWFCRVPAHGPFPGGAEDADGRSYSSANAIRGENPDEEVRAPPQECVAGAQSHRPAPEKLEKPDPRACGWRWTACAPSRKTALERSLVRPIQPPTLRKSGHSVARPRLSRTRGAMEKSCNGTDGGGWEAAEHGGQYADSESDPRVQIPLFLLIMYSATPLPTLQEANRLGRGPMRSDV